MNERARKLQIYPTVVLNQRKAAVVARGERLFDFGTGDPPEVTPAFVRQALIDAVPEVSQYPSVDGTPELRTAAMGYLARRFGVELDPTTSVLPTSGSKEAIFHLPMMLVDPSSGRDTVVWAAPGYAAFGFGTKFAGARECPVPLTAEREYLIRPDDLGAESLARTGLVFLNYPHNPSGQDMPPEVFREWVAARDEHGFVLVSDECYCDLYFGEPPHSLLEFGLTGCIAVHSLSKRSGMTGYLSGFVAGDPELIGVLRRFRAGMGIVSPVWTQAAAAAAWTETSHVEERRQLLAAKRQVVLDVLTGKGLKVYPGNASLFLWVEVPAGWTDVGYVEHLQEAGIVVAPGSMFGKEQSGFFRVALVPSIEDCRAVGEVWPD